MEVVREGLQVDADEGGLGLEVPQHEGQVAAAVQEAGGCVESVASRARGMTFEQFIATVAAQNNIRFVFDRPAEE